MTEVPADFVKAALAITPGFEVSGDPYIGISGDFDGMGISCGALQWNIGQNSLQPMVRIVGKQCLLTVMPQFGEQMWSACNSSISSGLSIVRGWQNGKRLKPAPKNELIALMGSAEMRAEQDRKIGTVATKAFNQATGWAVARGDNNASKRLFCWFFDVITQNGGLEGLTFAKTKQFIEANQPHRVDDLVCDFLKNQSGSSGHTIDAKKNAALWRNSANGEKLEILVMSYLRSQTASSQWRHVVLNRKGTVAMGSGWVNGSKWDFSAHGL